METTSIGPPPSRFSPSERAAWAEIVDEIPWLTRTDRKVVEVTARLSARMIDDPDVSIAALAQLRMCLGALGATPADRSRIHHSDDQPSDPADQYFN
ncbi:phage related protein [Stappia sp. 22II-S9-Z10]|nr:phage related protein [Stappia sp. 22II-S9-Z10]